MALNIINNDITADGYSANRTFRLEKLAWNIC